MAEQRGGTRSIFSERLKDLRTGHGYKQKGVARQIGVAQTTIANYEQVTRFPEGATLRKIADFFWVSIDWLFGHDRGGSTELKHQEGVLVSGGDQRVVDAYLGADLPTEGVVGAVEKMRPSVLAVSATMYFAIESVSALIAAVRRNPRIKATAIMVGGTLSNGEPELWRSIGTDGFGGSAREAVLCAKRLDGDTE